jgi:predicted RNase H-like HicB family nuclease
MTREYLVVFEKGEKNWSAFSPDIPGCGSLGDSLEETRDNMREAIEVYLDESSKAGERIPDASANVVNIEEFDPQHETKQYVIEWLPVTLPESVSPATSSQAA